MHRVRNDRLWPARFTYKLPESAAHGAAQYHETACAGLIQEEIVMKAHPLPMPLHLASREIVNIHDGAGLLVRSLHGVLWITQEDDSDDIVLEDGESFVLDRPGLALVSAIAGPADIVITPQPTVADRARSTGHRWPASRAA
jgi:Protein of unknown function (DUF2917)